tara:strand:+ start:30 stop:194 length:165 start_codon:yes stop_codon:yes gene_type:complete
MNLTSLQRCLTGPFLGAICLSHGLDVREVGLSQESLADLQKSQLVGKEGKTDDY